MKFTGILLVDDDDSDKEILEEIISLNNLSILVNYVENGVKALELLDTEYGNGALPKLIILDLNLPIMNGTQILEKLKADNRFSGIPVIIYSTSINPFEKEKCISLGACSYLTKPTSLKEGVELVHSFTSYL